MVATFVVRPRDWECTGTSRPASLITVACMALLVRTDSMIKSDFSVVLFRPKFMLLSEEYPMKFHKNQWLVKLPSPPDIPCEATNQGTHYGVWGADAFAVT